MRYVIFISGIINAIIVYRSCRSLLLFIFFTSTQHKRLVEWCSRSAMRHRHLSGPSPEVLGGAFRRKVNHWGDDDSEDEDDAVARNACHQQCTPVRNAGVAESHRDPRAQRPEDEAVHKVDGHDVRVEECDELCTQECLYPGRKLDNDLHAHTECEDSQAGLIVWRIGCPYIDRNIDNWSTCCWIGMDAVLIAHERPVVDTGVEQQHQWRHERDTSC